MVAQQKRCGYDIAIMCGQIPVEFPSRSPPSLGGGGLLQLLQLRAAGPVAQTTMLLLQLSSLLLPKNGGKGFLSAWKIADVLFQHF